MTRKKRITVSWLLGVLLLLSFCSISASAEGNSLIQPGMTIDGSRLTLAESAFSDDYGVAPHGDYLASGGCSITRKSNRIAAIDGYTGAYRVCDELYLGLYVDQLQDDGTWQTVYKKEVRGENGYHLSYSINIFVTPGYYYRMRAGHIARFGTIMESNVSITNGIYFGEGHDE